MGINDGLAGSSKRESKVTVRLTHNIKNTILQSKKRVLLSKYILFQQVKIYFYMPLRNCSRST